MSGPPHKNPLCQLERYAMFPIITVPDDAADLIEQLGTKPKFWYKHDNADYLFKEVRNNTGEDWARRYQVSCLPL